MNAKLCSPYPPERAFRCKLDSRGHVTELEEKAASCLGSPAESFIGKAWWTDVLRVPVAPNPQAIHEVTFLDAGKKLKKLLWLPIPSPTNSEEIAGLVLDISQSESLGNFPLQMSMAVEHGPAIVVITGPDGCIQYVNQKFSKITGYAREEVLGKHTRILKSGETPREAYKVLWETIASGKDWNGVFHNRKKNGELYWTAASISPVRDAAGRITNYLAVSEDITELREAMEESQLTQARLQSILDMAPDAIVTVDNGGIIKSFNRSAEKIFGYTVGEIVGKHVGLLVPPTEQKDRLEYLRDFLRREEQIFGEIVEIDAQRKDETIFPVELALSRANANEDLLFTGIARDITKAKEMRERLENAKMQAEKANEAKSLFLANMSHEIRTPLNGVMGMIDIVRETELKEEQSQHLALAQQSAHALLHIVNDILDFSKIEAGKLEVEFQPYNLWDLLRSALRSLAVRAHFKGLGIVCRMAPDVPKCLVGDSLRLRQVIMNVVGNAIKFTEKGEVEIAVSVREQVDNIVEIDVKITDTGIGIPPEKLETIFQPFTQADISTTRRFGGTGLGLAISSRLVKLMGGAIRAESAVGKGTTFEFTIKHQEFKEEPSQEEARLAELLRGTKALILDESPSASRALEEILSNWKVQTKVTRTKEEALIEVEKGKVGDPSYRFLIMENNSLKGEGPRIARDIQEASPPGKEPAIIIVMSKPRLPDVALFRDAGIAAYLYKPVFRMELSEILQRILLPQDKAKELATLPGVITPAISRALRILLVEDNPVNREVALVLLGRKGHEVTCAEHGLEALNILKESNFDLVLMDIHMPELDGLETTRRIRGAESPYQNIPIVAMTAGAMKGDQERCLAAGMNAYVSKPIQKEELFRIIETFVPQDSQKN